MVSLSPTIESAPEYAPLAALHLLLIVVCLAIFPIWVRRRSLWPLSGRPVLLDTMIFASLVAVLGCLVVNQLKGTVFYVMHGFTFAGFMMLVAYIKRVLWIKQAFQIAEKQQQIALGKISAKDEQVLAWLKAARTRRSWPVTVGVLVFSALVHMAFTSFAYGIAIITHNFRSGDNPILMVHATPVLVLLVILVVSACTLRPFPDDGYDMRSEQRKIGLALLLSVCLYLPLQAMRDLKYLHFLSGPLIFDFFFAVEIVVLAVIPLYKSFPRANVNATARSMSLVKIMGNVKALQQLRAFTMAEWSGENLQFLEAACAFTAAYTDRAADENLQVATGIIGTYIAVHAPLQVNISAECALSIPARLDAANTKGEPPPSDLFHDAVREIHNLVERDTVPRFRLLVSKALDKGAPGFEWVQDIAVRQSVLTAPVLALLVSENQKAATLTV